MLQIVCTMLCLIFLVACGGGTTEDTEKEGDGTETPDEETPPTGGTDGDNEDKNENDNGDNNDGEETVQVPVAAGKMFKSLPGTKSNFTSKIPSSMTGNYMKSTYSFGTLESNGTLSYTTPTVSTYFDNATPTNLKVSSFFSTHPCDSGQPNENSSGCTVYSRFFKAGPTVIKTRIESIETRLNEIKTRIADGKRRRCMSAIPDVQATTSIKSSNSVTYSESFTMKLQCLDYNETPVNDGDDWSYVAFGRNDTEGIWYLRESKFESDETGGYKDAPSSTALSKVHDTGVIELSYALGPHFPADEKANINHASDINSVVRARVYSDPTAGTIEITGYGSAISYNCGFHAKANDTYFWIEYLNEDNSPLTDNECPNKQNTPVDGTAVRECIKLSDFSTVADSNCTGADLDDYDLPSFFATAKEDLDARLDWRYVTDWGLNLSDNSELIDIKYPDPGHSIKKTFFDSDRSLYLNELFTPVQTALTRIETSLETPKQCVSIAPTAVTIENVGMTQDLSCIDETGDWLAFGLTGGRFDLRQANFATSINSDGASDSWFLAEYDPEVGASEKAVIHALAGRSENDLEIAVMGNNIDMACGARMKMNGTHIFVSGYFESGSDCTIAEDYQEVCLTVTDLGPVALSNCTDSGLNAFEVPPIHSTDATNEELITKTNYSTISGSLGVKPTGLTSVATALDVSDTSVIPGLTTSTENKKIDSLPVVDNVKNFTKDATKKERAVVSRNCKFDPTPAAQSSTLDILQTYDLSALTEAEFTALQAAVEADKSFITFSLVGAATEMKSVVSSWDIDVTVNLLDADDNILVSKGIEDLVLLVRDQDETKFIRKYNTDDSYQIADLFDGQTITNTMKLRLTASGSVTGTCNDTSSSGNQILVSGNVTNVELRF